MKTEQQTRSKTDIHEPAALLKQFNLVNFFCVSDRVKMYTHPYMDPDGGRESLQRKVQFDIRFYFCRRGAENMESMQRSMFAVKIDDKTQIEYVSKVEDEATKNHRETDCNIITAIMPENRGDKYCPVRSFKMYISHLHPENSFLWQTVNHHPKNKEDSVWYTKGHLGKNSLRPFMKDISTKCDLSKQYTNHCIRVTGATILTRSNFSAKEIMSVTGHKSVQSLTIYQHVKEPQKIQMGSVLAKSLTSTDDQLPNRNTLALPQKEPLVAIENTPKAAIHNALVPKQSIDEQQSVNALVPLDPDFDYDMSDIDLLAYITQAENEEKEKNAAIQNVPNRSITSTTTHMQQRNSPMFAGCRIGNINITINKN